MAFLCYSQKCFKCFVFHSCKKSNNSHRWCVVIVFVFLSHWHIEDRSEIYKKILKGFKKNISIKVLYQLKTNTFAQKYMCHIAFVLWIGYTTNRFQDNGKANIPSCMCRYLLLNFLSWIYKSRHLTDSTQFCAMIMA